MNRNLITQLGDACGGLVAVDEDIVFHWSLQWARILVQTNVERFQGFCKRWRVDQAFGSAIVGDFTMSGACSFVTHVQGV